MSYNLKPGADIEDNAAHVLETKKFFLTEDGEVAVRTGGVGNILSGIVFDAFTGEETSSTVETYRYYSGGTGGTLLATVVVTYSDDTKCFVSSVVRT